MNEEPESTPAAGAPPPPDPRLRALDPLVGHWTISGDAEGETTYEWILQRGRITRGGTTHSFFEVIGFERGFGATQTPVDITSRVYTTTGETLDYTYESEDETVTIWGGAKGSPAAFRANWNEDRTVLRGAWEWPGGGYSTVMARVDG